MEVLDHPVAECTAVAKRDLTPGQKLGKIGEYDYRGYTMAWRDARDGFALPLGLAERAKVLKPISKGERLTYDNCAPDDELVVTQIRRRMDQGRLGVSGRLTLSTVPSRRSACGRPGWRLEIPVSHLPVQPPQRPQPLPRLLQRLGQLLHLFRPQHQLERRHLLAGLRRLAADLEPRGPRPPRRTKRW